MAISKQEEDFVFNKQNVSFSNVQQLKFEKAKEWSACGLIVKWLPECRSLDVHPLCFPLDSPCWLTVM